MMIDQDDMHKEPEHDASFAKRMRIACDNISGMPAAKGRAAWIQRELNARGVKASLNTVHRWYSGTMRPRNQKLLVLAEVLKVDSAWLALGQIPELDLQEKKHFDSSAEASVNVVMGFVQMAGWECAFPDEDDPRRESVHFYSIIKGKQHRFHISFGLKSDDGTYTFAAPVAYQKCTIVGLIAKGPLEVELVRIPTSVLDAADSPRKGTIKIVAKKSGAAWIVGTQRLQVITDFSAPLVD